MQNLPKAGTKPAAAALAADEPRSAVRRKTAARAVIALVLLPLLGGAVLAAEVNPLAEKVRSANARFADTAVAASEGYSPIPCVSGADGGAMGIHYVNKALIEDPDIDISSPEAVLYEPGADGKLELVAVEYLTPKGPAQLGGQLFNFMNAQIRYGLPAVYELHVWAWRDNPTGTFSDMNPDVSCAMAMGDM
jgi:hypothetical protein